MKACIIQFKSHLEKYTIYDFVKTIDIGEKLLYDEVVKLNKGKSSGQGEIPYRR